MKKILITLGILCVGTAFAAMPANKLYEEKVNSVLFIETQSGTGSGIVLKEDGTFVTCFHVIDNADYINAKTKDGKTYKVNGYKYLNPKNDVAILTITSKNKFTPITLNDKINIGDIIYTIANPKKLQFVFSDGMINQFSKEKIQFSAPTSPGSSGGALLNENGELIGMITSQYNPSKAQNINFALPNSYFAPYMDKKKKSNSKNMNWTEFVVSTLKEKDLAEFINYAMATDNRTMVYKYMKGLTEEIESDDYALYGSMAILSFMENAGEKNLIDDAMKWFALSINSNKNIELSAYGLFLGSFLSMNVDNYDIYYDYIKKYPRTKKVLNKQIDELLKCNKNDYDCIDNTFYNMSNYLNFLAKDVYKSNGTKNEKDN